MRAAILNRYPLTLKGYQMQTITREIRIPKGARTGPAQEPIYGWEVLPAACYRGLCVHKALPGSRWKWMVTHEASGLKLDRIGAMTKARAIENMTAAAALDFDWTKGERETLNALRASRGIVDAISRIGERN
jgi:hypothetical protein